MRVADRVEAFPTYLEAEWEAVPALAAEWGSWSPRDQMNFAVDCPIREDRLAQLEALDQASRLTAP